MKLRGHDACRFVFFFSLKIITSSNCVLLKKVSTFMSSSLTECNV